LYSLGYREAAPCVYSIFAIRRDYQPPYTKEPKVFNQHGMVNGYSNTSTAPHNHSNSPHSFSYLAILFTSFALSILNMPRLNLHVFGAGLLLTTAAHASVLPRGQGENVALANCKNGAGQQSSQMAYFSGGVGGIPAAIAITQTGATTWWEGNTITGTFADGNKFVSQIIAPTVAAGAYAGPGHNNQGGFYCYHNYVPGAYNDGKGNNCDMIYDCSHNAPPSGGNGGGNGGGNAGATERIDFQVGGDYVTVVGTFNGADILNSIDQALGDPYCKTQTIPILDSQCKIQYSCHGDVPGQTTKGMAQFLKDAVSKADGLISHFNKKVRECIDTNPEAKPGQDPCIYGYVDQAMTKVASSLTMNAVYLPPNNPAGDTDQGQLSYTINCPTSQDCGLCGKLATGLGLAGQIPYPESQAVFGVAGFITSGICLLAGC
jgi:hypothetical protein